MLILLFVSAQVISAGACFFMFKNAPEGFEDENGFHLGKDSGEASTSVADIWSAESLPRYARTSRKIASITGGGMSGAAV